MTDADSTRRFQVEFTPRAARALRKLDRVAQSRLVATLGLLRENPRPPAAKALVGRPGYLRVRTGDYRIIYRVGDGKLIVLALPLGHRRSIYDQLP